MFQRISTLAMAIAATEFLFLFGIIVALWRRPMNKGIYKPCYDNRFQQSNDGLTLFNDLQSSVSVAPLFSVWITGKDLKSDKLEKYNQKSKWHL